MLFADVMRIYENFRKGQLRSLVRLVDLNCKPKDRAAATKICFADANETESPLMYSLSFLSLSLSLYIYMFRVYVCVCVCVCVRARARVRVCT
jgi:hypothetical protein